VTAEAREPYEKPEVQELQLSDLIDEAHVAANRARTRIEELRSEMDRLYARSGEISLILVKTTGELEVARTALAKVHAIIDLTGRGDVQGQG